MRQTDACAGRWPGADPPDVPELARDQRRDPTPTPPLLLADEDPAKAVSLMAQVAERRQRRP